MQAWNEFVKATWLLPCGSIYFTTL